MWERNMKVLIFPVLFALGSTRRWVVSIYHHLHMTFTSVAAGIWIPFDGLGFDLILICGSTLVTNITATTLIAVKAWSVTRQWQCISIAINLVTGNIVA